MNGTFKVSLSTPLGMKSGLIRFYDEGGRLSGSIRAMGQDNPFWGGRTNGSSFEISGELSIGFGRIAYTAAGTVQGDTLTATARTKFGEFALRGTRVAG